MEIRLEVEIGIQDFGLGLRCGEGAKFGARSSSLHLKLQLRWGLGLRLGLKLKWDRSPGVQTLGQIDIPPAAQVWELRSSPYGS